MLTPEYFHDGATKLVQNPSFVESTKSNGAPLPMLAFAKIVVDDMLRRKEVDVQKYFNGLTMTVPSSYQQSMQPEYHSICGQKLLYVN